MTLLLHHLRRHLQQPLTSMTHLESTQAILTKTNLHLIHPHLLTSLIAFAALSPFGCLSHAHSLLQTTAAITDPFACSTLIRAFSNSDFPANALHLYNHMITNQIPADHFTFNFALKASAKLIKCAKRTNIDSVIALTKGGEIHCRVLKLGFGSDLYVGNSLMFVYAQIGAVRDARNVFDEMSERSVSSWNIMVSAYDQIGDFGSADLVMGLMPERNVATWNGLLARHVRLGDVRKAEEVFREMEERDVVSWNSMIAGYVRGGDYVGALRVFREMEGCGLEGNEVTMVSVLGACAEVGELEIGRGIHESLRGRRNRIGGYLGTALVDMYSKCGKLSLGWEVFRGMKMRPIGCWNAMIMGFAVHGHCKEALKLFVDMEMEVGEVKPNRITFVGVLIACSHKGLVEEGRRYFSYMIQKYKITPDVKHYGCMVDLFSRCGRLDEAYEMIKAVPPSLASSLLWRTLLGACKVHGNVELAERCFEQLAELEPPKDADYVLLSNIYAEAEKWDDVQRLRNEMISKGVPKSHGFSHVKKQAKLDV